MATRNKKPATPAPAPPAKVRISRTPYRRAFVETWVAMSANTVEEIGAKLTQETGIEWSTAATSAFAAQLRKSGVKLPEKTRGSSGANVDDLNALIRAQEVQDAVMGTAADDTSETV